MAQNRRRADASAAPQARNAAENISEQQLKAWLSFIAADEVGGRDTPSRGLDLTGKFIAMNLSTWGLKPAGDGNSFFQRIPLRRERIDLARTRAEINGKPFAYGPDFISLAMAAGTAAGPLVYVGHGWVHEGKGINAYEGVDVREKIMVVAGGGYPPDAITFRDTLRSGGWAHPYEYAQRHGAKGVIFLPHFRTLSEWEAHEQRTLSSGTISVVGRGRPRTAGGFYEGAFHRWELDTSCCGLEIPAITASAEMFNPLLSGEKLSAGALLSGKTATGEQVKAFDLNPDKRMSFTVALAADTVYAHNVLAVLEGSDPALRHEYVAVGAHYDTVGLEGIAGDGGADDNGSGTVAVMAMAKAFAAGDRPKRSVLFTWYAGEEKGLWGSRHFVEHPTVPLDQIVAYVNLDMVGRSKDAADSNPQNAGLTGPDEVYVLGPKLTSTELGELSERVNRSYLNLRLNYRYDDPNAPEGLFRRSDDYPYAQKGIPIIYYFTGFHADYHAPSDTPEKIDYRKIGKVARTAFLTLWELAHSLSRPRYDKPLLK